MTGRLETVLDCYVARLQAGERRFVMLKRARVVKVDVRSSSAKDDSQSEGEGKGYKK